MASTEPESCQTPSPAGENDSEPAKVSKKQAKKEAQKAERLRKQKETATAAAAASAEASEVDPFSENYGDVPTEKIQSKAVSGGRWTEIGSLDAELADRTVLIRGAVLVVRQYMSTVQCRVLVVNKECVSPQMVKFATGLSKDSIVDIEGVVSIPKDPVKGTTQQLLVAFYYGNRQSQPSVLPCRRPTHPTLYLLLRTDRLKKRLDQRLGGPLARSGSYY